MNHPEKHTLNKKAITSFILGILSVILFLGTGFILGVIGLIFGIFGLKKVNRTKQKGRKFAITGIVCSSLGITFQLIVVVFALLGGFAFGPGVTDFDYPLSNGYELTHNNPLDVFVLPKDGYTKNSEIIPPKVVKIAWNSHYVIAEQQLIDEPKKGQSGIGKLTNTYHYWILDTKKRMAYGPFNKKTFTKQLKAFGIPDSLQLRDVDSYKKN